MEALKLVKSNIPLYAADGSMEWVSATQLNILRTAGRIARLIERKKDKAISRAYRKAQPDEVATRITAAAEVVKVGASTWIHTRNLGLLGRRVAV